MENIEALQAKKHFFEQDIKFESCFAKKDEEGIKLLREEYLEWMEDFCKKSSDETLIAFIVLMRDEIKGRKDALIIELDTISRVKKELYDRAVSNMQLRISASVIALTKEGIRLAKYYDSCDLRGKTTFEIPEDLRQPLDEYINKVLKTCTLEEDVALLPLFTEALSEYIGRTRPHSHSFTRGYNIKSALTESIQNKVLEEKYAGQKAKEYFVMQRNKYLSYCENKNQANIKLLDKEFSEWREVFCKESSNETLVAFIKLINEEMNGNNEFLDMATEIEAIAPVKFELYNRAVSNMELRINEHVATLTKEGLRLVEYYDSTDFSNAKPYEIPEDACKPLDEYINKVLGTCTLEEAVVLLSLFEDNYYAYVRRNKNQRSFSRGYNITTTLRNSIKDKVLEETYFNPKQAIQDAEKRPKRLVGIFDKPIIVFKN